MLVTYSSGKIRWTIRYPYAPVQCFQSVLAYSVMTFSYKHKLFMNLTPVANVIKLFTAVSYYFS